jgi:hypothetical protein
MKLIRQMLVAAWVATLLTSCSKDSDETPPSVIHGQVFVVLKPGNALKLALASVRVLPEAEALAAAAAAQKQSDAATNETASIENQLASRRAALRREQEQLAAEVEDMKARRDFSGTYASKVAAVGAIEDELTSLDSLNATGESMRPTSDPRSSSRQFAETLIAAAKPSAVTRTNADGEFSIEVPKTQGRVALLIEASRELETVERFVWFVWLDQLVADSGVLLFSNHNVLDSGTSANVINVATPAN